MLRIKYHNITDNTKEIEIIDYDFFTGCSTIIRYDFLKDSKEFQMTSYSGFHYLCFKKGDRDPERYFEEMYSISNDKLLEIMKKVVELEPETVYDIKDFYS